MVFMGGFAGEDMSRSGRRPLERVTVHSSAPPLTRSVYAPAAESAVEASSAGTLPDVPADPRSSVSGEHVGPDAA